MSTSRGRLALSNSPESSGPSFLTLPFSGCQLVNVQNCSLPFATLLNFENKTIFLVDLEVLGFGGSERGWVFMYKKGWKKNHGWDAFVLGGVHTWFTHHNPQSMWLSPLLISFVCGHIKWVWYYTNELVPDVKELSDSSLWAGFSQHMTLQPDEKDWFLGRWRWWPKSPQLLRANRVPKPSCWVPAPPKSGNHYVTESRSELEKE